jgi:hypothetical protein
MPTPVRDFVRALVLASLAGASLAHAAGPADLPPLDPRSAAQLSFRHDVWPVLKRHCWGCHSGADPKGGLSMDDVAGLAKGGFSGAAIAPGEPDESLLVRVLCGAAEPAMPPNAPSLPVAKIHVLRQWILAGAVDDSFATPASPTIAIPEVYAHPPAVTALAFSPDGRWLAAACRSEVVFIDAAGEAPPRRLPTECDLVTYVEFSPDGTLLCAAGGVPAAYGEVRFFNAADGSLRDTRRAGNDTFFRGGFSPDGTTVALGGSDGAVHIVPVSAGGELRKHDLHSDWIVDVCYSPDAKFLITAGRDKAVKVAYAETGKLIRSVATSAEFVNSVAATAGLAISAGRDRVPAAYDLRLALGDTVFNGPVDNGFKPVDLSTQYTKQLEGQPGEVLDLAMNGDRSLVAVAGAFGEARVYQTADNSRFATVAGLIAPLYAVALSPDGTRLAAGGRSGQVVLFELPSARLLRTIQPVPVETTR